MLSFSQLKVNTFNLILLLGPMVRNKFRYAIVT